jgi:extracellular elastinolytic metalloproteinase
VSCQKVSGLALAALVLSLSPAFAQDVRDFGAAGARVTRNPNGAPLTGPSNSARPEIVARFLQGRHGRPTLDSLVLDGVNVTRNVTHLRFRQQVAGLDVFGTYVRAAITPRGEIVSIVENLADVGAPLGAGTGSHRGALESALAEFYPGMTENLPELGRSGETITFARGPRLLEDPAVTRVAVPMTSGAMQIGYLVVTWDRDNVLRHTLVGNGGRILLSELRTNTDTYKVYAKNPDLSAHLVVSGPGAGNAQSPSGWVTNDTTTGNNVDAYLDRDNNNAADQGGRPVSATKNFEYTIDLSQAPTTATNQMAAVTNLFYLTNLIHDKLYQHGFTEAAGNFQTNNFTAGGAGNDPVLAEAQDGGSLNNANFATLKPRMQVYLWDKSDPNRDGDLDSDIVWHEYGHGLTWRMIGNMTGPLAGAVAEGMGDALAIYANRKDVVGEYSYNAPGGIRRYPFTNYPLKYGGVSGSSVHDDGEIYAATLWKLLEMWEGEGRTQDALFDVIIGGMNFTPAQPAFEDMRDGMLAAAATAAEDCTIWRAFAQFGIGEGADARARCNFFGCKMNITESFAVPAACSAGGGGAPAVAINSPGDASSHPEGSPVIFSATAQDDGADISGSLTWTSSLDGTIGTGASFSTSLLSLGAHTITASVTDGDGLTGTASIGITVVSGGGPEISLSLAGRKAKAINFVDLTWSGATTDHIDIWRNGTKLLVTTNGGFYSDNTRTKGSVTFTYKVCEFNSTINCSPERTIVF